MPTGRGLILHGAWLNMGGGRLAIWAEAEVKPVKRRAPQTDPAEPAAGYRSHPFCARREELVDALERLWRTARPGVAPRASAPVERIALWLPRLGVRPVPSPTYVVRGWAPEPEDADSAVMSVWRVNALLLQPESACTLLAGLPIGTDPEAAPASLQINPFTTQRRLGASPMPLGDDLRFWAAAARFLMRVALRQRYVPSVSATHVDEFGYPCVSSAILSATARQSVTYDLDSLQRSSGGNDERVSAPCVAPTMMCAEMIKVVLLCTSGNRSVADMAHTSKWTYRTVRAIRNGDGTDVVIADSAVDLHKKARENVPLTLYLDELGAVGWEACGAFGATEAHSPATATILLKQPIL